MLASKKRYVGFMFESPGQMEPAFDAKGIETVRRDACPVVAKMLERSIRILFSTHDLSLVSLRPLRPRTQPPSAHAQPRLCVQGARSAETTQLDQVTWGRVCTGRDVSLTLPGACR